ncbi:MAG: hypothetical protein H6728_06705 [Myxococcales bacterium]|nr:hypothetical protein [Myxococcales bacterium]
MGPRATSPYFFLFGILFFLLFSGQLYAAPPSLEDLHSNQPLSLALRLAQEKQQPQRAKVLRKLLLYPTQPPSLQSTRHLLELASQADPVLSFYARDLLQKESLRRQKSLLSLAQHTKGSVRLVALYYLLPTLQKTPSLLCLPATSRIDKRGILAFLWAWDTIGQLPPCARSFLKMQLTAYGVSPTKTREALHLLQGDDLSRIIRWLRTLPASRPTTPTSRPTTSALSRPTTSASSRSTTPSHPTRHPLSASQGHPPKARSIGKYHPHHPQAPPKQTPPKQAPSTKEAASLSEQVQHLTKQILKKPHAPSIRVLTEILQLPESPHLLEEIHSYLQQEMSAQRKRPSHRLDDFDKVALRYLLAHTKEQTTAQDALLSLLTPKGTSDRPFTLLEIALWAGLAQTSKVYEIYRRPALFKRWKQTFKIPAPPIVWLNIGILHKLSITLARPPQKARRCAARWLMPVPWELLQARHWGAYESCLFGSQGPHPLSGILQPLARQIITQAPKHPQLWIAHLQEVPFLQTPTQTHVSRSLRQTAYTALRDLLEKLAPLDPRGYTKMLMILLAHDRLLTSARFQRWTQRPFLKTLPPTPFSSPLKKTAPSLTSQQVLAQRLAFLRHRYLVMTQFKTAASFGENALRPFAEAVRVMLSRKEPSWHRLASLLLSQSTELSMDLLPFLFVGWLDPQRHVLMRRILRNNFATRSTSVE